VATTPHINYGGVSILTLGSNSTTDENSSIWIKFDLYDPINPNHLQPGDEITWASVTVRGEVKMNGTPSLLIGAYSCDNSSWSETDLTWNNAPWSAVSLVPLDQSTIHYGYGYVSGYELNSTAYFFTVTAAVQQAHTQGQDVTIILKAETEGNQYFWAHEDTNFWSEGNKPILEVQYIPGGDDESPINTGVEYASGTISEDSLWYTWINVTSAQLIFITGIYPLYNLYFPSFHLLGQHFHAEDGTELFIGHMLLFYEVYDDENDNGILDADFTLGTYETRYYLDLNISDVFIPQPVQRTFINGSPHYVWSLRYENVWGFLKFPEGPQPPYGDTAGVLWLEYLETSYDYFIQANATYLKTSLHLGSITQLDAFLPNLTLTNLGITALYSTILLASSGTTRILIESSEYNSQLPNPILPMSNATIIGQTTGYYSLLFDENYTLHSIPPQSLPAPSAACPSTSVNPIVHSIQYREPFNAFRDFLTSFLPHISSLSMPPGYAFEHSSLLYRVNYPHWNGSAITHDPLYVAYLRDAPQFTLPSDFSPWPILILAVAILGVIALSLSLFELHRIRTIKTQEEH
jgi:hypothetical protein